MNPESTKKKDTPSPSARCLAAIGIPKVGAACSHTIIPAAKMRSEVSGLSLRTEETDMLREAPLRDSKDGVVWGGVGTRRREIPLQQSLRHPGSPPEGFNRCRPQYEKNERRGAA